MTSHEKNNGENGMVIVTVAVNLFLILTSPVLALFGFVMGAYKNTFQKSNTQQIRRQKYLKGLGALNRSKERVLDLTILNGGKYGHQS
jgi:hypothetical protein